MQSLIQRTISMLLVALFGLSGLTANAATVNTEQTLANGQIQQDATEEEKDQKKKKDGEEPDC